MMDQSLAETRALQILAWLAGKEDLFPVFMGSTGASEADIRNRAADPEFLASVLDFMVLDDDWVLECAEDLQFPPQEILEIRAALPGGDLPSWT